MWFLLLLLLTRAILKNSEGFMFVYTWMFGFILICVWIDFVDLTWGGWGGTYGMRRVLKWFFYNGV